MHWRHGASAAYHSSVEQCELWLQSTLHDALLQLPAARRRSSTHEGTWRWREGGGESANQNGRELVRSLAVLDVNEEPNGEGATRVSFEREDGFHRLMKPLACETARHVPKFSPSFGLSTLVCLLSFDCSAACMASRNVTVLLNNADQRKTVRVRQWGLRRVGL